MAKTVLRKGAARSMQSTVTSASQAKRLSKAIKALQETPLNDLKRRGLVKKVHVTGRDDIYAYRVGLKERIVFSQVGGRNVIHDIVDFSNKRSTKSLLVAKDRDA